jgi:hypothetical protein
MVHHGRLRDRPDWGRTTDGRFDRAALCRLRRAQDLGISRRKSLRDPALRRKRRRRLRGPAGAHHFLSHSTTPFLLRLLTRRRRDAAQRPYHDQEDGESNKRMHDSGPALSAI